MVIAISGSRGMIGSAVVDFLAKKQCIIKRIVRTCPAGEAEIFCDPVTGCVDTDALEGVDAVIHLAGENIAGRWTSQKKFDIYHSRTHGTDVLGRAIINLKKKPKHFICASAIGFYGDRGDCLLDESSGAGNGFLADLCAQWEANTQRISGAGVRVVNLRFAMVLDKSGGALAKMLIPFKLGLGGGFGSGSQYMSWITLTDAVRAINYVLEHHSIAGPVNICSPNPVTNKEFTKTLAKVLKRPAFLNVPSGILNIMLGEFAKEVLLASSRAIPEKMTNAGFDFESDGLKTALESILK